MIETAFLIFITILISLNIVVFSFRYCLKKTETIRKEHKKNEI